MYEFEEKFIYSYPKSVKDKLGYSKTVRDFSQEEILNILNSLTRHPINVKTIQTKDLFYEPNIGFSFDKLQRELERISYQSPFELISRYKEALSSNQETFTPYLRCRTSLEKTIEKIQENIYLTFKDSSTKEEFEISLSSPLEEKIFVLGLTKIPKRTKQKIQTKYETNINGYQIAIELNKIPELENIEFLEIEVISEEESIEAQNLVYEIARTFSIEEPEKSIEQGGLNEKRAYYKLFQLLE